MKKRDRRGTGRSTLRLAVLVSLLVATGLLSGTVGAHNPPPASTPVRGGPTPWITTVGSLEAPVEIRKPVRGHPRLESSLNQLLEAHRREGLAGAQAFARMHTMVLDDERVQVVIETIQGAMNDLTKAVKALGGEYQTHYETLLQALVPIDALESLAGRPDVRVVREPRRPMPVAPGMAGTVDTEGLGPSNVSAWHGAGYTGSGVRVAVIDGGFTDYASLLGTDLPASVTTYDWTGRGMGGSYHGTACAEVVHDMAPGAMMYLHKVGTEVDLGNAVSQAIADGVDIISMSLIWLLGGPGDGTGFLAGIVSNARSNGIFYATAAGNNAEHCWSGTYNDSGSDIHLWASGQDINYFGPGNGDAWIIPKDFPIAVALHWDDWTVVDQNYDIELHYWDGNAWQFVEGSYNDQAAGYPTPEEYIELNAPVEAPYGVVVRRTSSTRDVCLRLNVSHAGYDLDERVPERSLMFPADSPDAITVAAVDVSSPYPLESYSSQGPTFGPGGTCYGGSTRPDIAAYANVSTVSYGANAFAGTSAATPHVAGAAALVKQAFPGYTVDQLQDFLEGRALNLGGPGKDNLYGSGRLWLDEPPAGTVTPTPTATNTPTPTPTFIPTTGTPTPTGTPPPGVTIYLPLVMKLWPPVPDIPLLHSINNPNGDRNYTVSWSPAARATSYTLEEDDHPAFSSPTTLCTGSGTSWEASDKEIGTYYYRVRASNSWGNGGWSNVQSVSVRQPPSTFTSVADTTIFQGYPDENLGHTSDMWAGYDDYLDPDGKIVRSLVQFDLAGIPAGTQIASASLKLFLVDSWDYPGRSRTITTYRIKSGWSETSVTWNTKPSYGDSYGTASARHGDWRWYSFDVTDLVRAWVNGTKANCGIMVRGPEHSGQDSSWKGFSTREGPFPPQLVIHYTGSTVSAAPTGIATGVVSSESILNVVSAVGHDGRVLGLDDGRRLDVFAR